MDFDFATVCALAGTPIKQPIKLKVGKKYLTLDGNIAVILHELENAITRERTPFIGYVQYKWGQLLYQWNESGQTITEILNNTYDGNSIVSEYIEPEEGVSNDQ